MSIVGIVIALVLVALNAFFVAAEFAFVKVRETQIEEMARSGSRPAKRVQRIKQNLETYLSATQLGVTLASLGLGSVGEPAIAHTLEPLFGSRGASHVVGVVAAFTLITYFHIVFGELAPKWFSNANPAGMASRLALPLDLFSRLLHPIIWLLNTTARGILTPFGLRPANEGEHAHSPDELRLVIAHSQEAGTIPESAEEIADRAFHFGQGRVKDVMTPRPEVVFLSLTDSLSENLAKAEHSRYARFPVCRDGMDDVIGRIHVRDLLSLMTTQRASPPSAASAALEGYCAKVLFVPENKRLDDMLDDFRSQRMEMAIVQDEYGLTAGVVTLEDVLEELVGEIQQEFTPSPSEVQALPDGSYLVDYKMTLTRLKREYDAGEEVEGIDTIGGYILSTMNGLPRLGYKTTLGNWQAEIVEMAGRRIRRVRLSPLPVPQ